MLCATLCEELLNICLVNAAGQSALIENCQDKNRPASWRRDTDLNDVNQSADTVVSQLALEEW